MAMNLVRQFIETRRSRTRAGASIRWFRPRLLNLEDRTVPSTITWTNRGQASDRFDSTFGANANLARGVIDATLTSWTRVLTSFNQPGGGNNINVTISMSSSGTGFGAGTSVSLSNGFPVAGTITIARGNDTNGDGLGDGAGYFLDPTPLENSEFAGSILHAFTADVQAGSPASGLADLFTPIVHEVGHLVGMIGGSSRLQNPLNGTVTNTGIADNSEGGGIGTYRVFDGPSVTHLMTSNNGGPGGQDAGALIHSAGPPGNQPVSFNSAFRGTRQLVGTQDIINPVYEFNRRYLVADYLALILKDAYNYTVTMPQSFGTFYAILSQTTGNLLVRGSSAVSNDDIRISRSGSNIVVSVDLGTDPAGVGPNGDNSPVGAYVTSFPASSVNSITVQAGAGVDKLTVDFAGGNPIPTGGLSYNGGSNPGDDLTVTGGTFTTATINATGANTGNVNLDGSVLTYSAITSITSSIAAASLVFNLPASATQGTLTTSGANLLLDSTNSSFTDTTIVPTGVAAITLNGGNSNDQFTLANVSAVFDANANPIVMNGGGGTDTIIVNAGGILAANTNHSAALQLNDGTVRLTAAAEFDSLAGTVAGIANLGSNTLTVGSSNATTTFGGAANGSGGLTKVGTGTLTLAGTNTYTGATTINGGTLLVNGSLAAGSAVSVNASGVLGGTGAANGNVTVNTNGNVAPGTSPGLLTIGGLTLSTGALSAELNGVTAGTEYDQLAVNGVVTLGGSLNVTVGFAAPLGTQFRLIDNDGTDAIVGSFAGLAQGATVNFGGQDFTISYSGGTGNDVVLTRGAVAAAPRVANVQVNAGQGDLNQRSRVTILTVTFDAVVTFAGQVADAFTLSRAGGASVAFTATSNVVGGVTVVTLTGFGGAETRFGSLGDGFFNLMVLSGQISANGLQLDGDGDGTPGGDFAQNGTLANGLFSLYGDANGDGVVNAFDFSQIRNAFGSSAGDLAYRDFLDFDGNGSINAFDFGQFRNRFGSGVP